MKRKILVTGAAGFIGSHLSRRLMEEGHTVLGIDSLNEYYDVSLKHARLTWVQTASSFQFEPVDITDKDRIFKIFETFQPTEIVHLAAQAGVRYSLTHPDVYIHSNVQGTLNLLEACRFSPVKHFLYASSSSVYGGNKKVPFSENDPTDTPVSLYAASKKSTELLAYSYSHLFGVPATGLRFFTVYGPWGRPDMALFIFTKGILEGKPIQLFNHGKHRRDFTYIDDILQGITALIDKPPTPRSPEEKAATRVFNIGNNRPVWLEDMVSILEKELGKKAIRENKPMQAGDIFETHADISQLHALTGYEPTTPLEKGIPNFVRWYREYYKV